MRAIYLGGFLAMAVTTQAVAIDLKLRCQGMASTLEAKSSFGSISGDIDARTSSTTLSAGQRRALLLVEINDLGGRVRPPSVILPPIRGKGDGDGWWKLDNLVIGETEITGRFSLNFISKPAVRIDRTTGDIDLSWSSNILFSGRCSVADPAERAF